MNSIRVRIREELDYLNQNLLLRCPKVPMGHDFCSNDYFGLSTHPDIIAAATRGLSTYGYGSTSSRLVRGERDIHKKLQNALASFMHCEDALLYSSGFAANLGVLTSLIKKNDVVFSDELNHASIIDGLKLSGARVIIFPHRDVDFLETKIKEESLNIQKFIISESIFSMDGTIAPLNKYALFAREYNLGLIIDEAHALGIYGPKGSGLIEHFGIGPHILCRTAGFGKAFGTYGGVASGPQEVINLLLQKSRSLIYTTALPPATLCAIEAALKIIINADAMRAKLFANSNLLRLNLNKNNLDLPSIITPVIIGENNKALYISKKLQEAGFDIRAIRPPTVPNNTARLRITSHSTQDAHVILELTKELLDLL